MSAETDPAEDELITRIYMHAWTDVDMDALDWENVLAFRFVK